MPPIIKPSSNGHATGGLTKHLASGGGRLPTDLASASSASRDNTPTLAAHPVKGSRVVAVGGPGGRHERSGIVGKLTGFLHRYIVLPEQAILVIAAWIIAAWLSHLWDRFPHLAVTSPEKRCGKTRLLQLTEPLCPRCWNIANMTPAVVYRLIAKEKPTLLLDEAQTLARRGSESSEVIREIFCAAIDANAKVLRMGGKKFEDIIEFPIYCPKVLALIGDLDGVLADRCLNIRLERKTDGQQVEQYRSRIVAKIGEELREELNQWTIDNWERIRDVYDHLEPFVLDNDRLAELLLPLQAVLTVADPDLLPELLAYALHIDSAEGDRMSHGVRLLMSLREIFAEKGLDFVQTATLLTDLCNRADEPWGRWSRGDAMTDEQLAKMLRPYGIRPEKQQRKINGKNHTARGYGRERFADAWARYCPSPAKT